MARVFNVVLLVLIIVFVGAFAGFAQSPSIKPMKAPNFSLKNAKGKTVELKKLEGKVVVLNFWATWCGPCRAEIPGFIEVYKEYKSKGLEIVGISLDSDGWTKVRPYIEKSKIPYPIVVDDYTVAQTYGQIDAIPTTYIVDKKGNIVNRHVGYMNKEALVSMIKELL